MADAVDSKSTVRKGVRVRIPPRAPQPGGPEASIRGAPAGVRRGDGAPSLDQVPAPRPWMFVPLALAVLTCVRQVAIGRNERRLGRR